jgi:hypothetical protein
MGTCGVTCLGGSTLCGSKCVELSNDPANCGSCGNACPVAQVCSAGACGVTCLGGTTLCGGKCVDTTNNPANCGSCGNACSLPHAAALCANAACVIGQCLAGYGDCNKDATDGCEHNLTTDQNNCGACGNVCALTPQTASVTCVASSCAVAACTPGYGDCNGTYADGCEVNLLNDPLNCNVCAYSCTACVNGACPLAAFIRHQPVNIALDPNNVYWTNDSGVRSVPKSGGGATVLSSSGYPFGIAVAGTHLFWSDPSTNAINRIETDGTNPMVLTTGPVSPGSMVTTDGMNVYWANYQGQSVFQVPVNGGTATPVATGLGSGATGVAVLGGTVYWAVGQTIQSAPVGGGAVSVLASNQVGPSGIVATAMGIYWTTITPQNAVMGLFNGTTVPTTIAGNQPGVVEIATDGVNLYWTTYVTLAKAPLGGGAVTVLVANQSTPQGLAVDDTSVYWYDDGTKTINKAPK